MANLVKWDTLKDLSLVSRNLDSFSRDFMEFPEFLEENDYPSPPIETFRHNGSFVVKVELPGVNPNDVHLKAEEGYLTIEGERKRTETIPESSFLREEMWYGPFKRTLPLPEGVKIDEMKAKYQNGILEITAPIDSRYLPKKIEVEVKNN